MGMKPRYVTREPVVKSSAPLLESVVEMTRSDLFQRIRVAKTWGVDGDIVVTDSALRWAIEQLVKNLGSRVAEDLVAAVVGQVVANE